MHFSQIHFGVLKSMLRLILAGNEDKDVFEPTTDKLTTELAVLQRLENPHSNNGRNVVVTLVPSS